MPRAKLAALALLACLVCVAWLLARAPQDRPDKPCRPLPRDAEVFRYLSATQVERIVPRGTTSLALLASHVQERQEAEMCPNLARYVGELAQQFELVVVLTNRRVSTQLPPNCRVVVAPNQGLDFGKWMYVLHNARLPALRRLGLFNDSAFLVRSLHPCFRRSRQRGWRVWGMTRSSEGEPHLQSFFVVADGAAAASHMLGFFSGRSMQHTMAPCYSKVDLVREFEFGLSAHLGSRFTLHACFGVETETNPSLDHWDELLDQGCPLLKKLRRRKVQGEDLLARLDPEYAATIHGIDDRAFVTPPPA